MTGKANAKRSLGVFVDASVEILQKRDILLVVHAGLPVQGVLLEFRRRAQLPPLGGELGTDGGGGCKVHFTKGVGSSSSGMWRYLGVGMDIILHEYFTSKPEGGNEASKKTCDLS